MDNYIATFFTHYDALVFARKAEAIGIKSVCLPVPRALSSSCGTAVCFMAKREEADKLMSEDVEQIALEACGKYTLLYDNR